MSARTPHADLDQIQARAAARVVAALNLQAAALPHDVSERLRVARDRAVALARQQRLAAAPAVVGRSGGAATLAGPGGWWWKAASVLPLVMLVLGMLMIDRFNVDEQIRAAAEIDALLLADDLPPQAYTDPGFGEFLRSPAQ
jgi:hypothetical protein